MGITALENLQKYKARLNVERIEYAIEKLQEFKQSIPEELVEVFHIEPTSIFSNGRGINANVTVGEVELVLDYDIAQNLYTVQFLRPVDVTGETSEWTSKQTFEKLVDYILFVAKKRECKSIWSEVPDAKYTRRLCW